MGFLDNLKKVASSAMTTMESATVAADEIARNKAKKMTDKELKSYADRTGKSNRYVEEEIRNRGI